MKRRLRRAVPAIVFAAIVLGLCWRVWTPISGARSAFKYDALWEYWGDVVFQIHAVKRGELPVWNPFDRTGCPYFADPQTGTLYPFTWGLVGLGLAAGVDSGGQWLVAFKIMFHLWLWGLGMYAWLRRRGLPAPPCYAAGVFCILAYPTVHGLFSALHWGMAWAPWVLLAIERYAERPGLSRASAVALALAMCQLAGAPASTWYTLVIAIPYGTWALLHHRPPWRRVAVTGAVAATLFLLMVAGQALVTSALVKHTVRDARDLAFIADTGLKFDNLFGLVVPRMPEMVAYLGMINIVGALMAVVLRPSGRVYTLAGVAVVGLLLAMGDDAGILPSLASFLPPAGYFRRAHRYLFVTMVPLAALGAEGLAALAELEAEKTRVRVGRFLLALGLAGTVIFGCGVVVTTGKLPKFHDAYITAFYAWAACAVVLWMLVTAPSRWRPVVLGLAAVVSCLDMWVAHSRDLEANWVKPPDISNDPKIQALAGVPLEARIYDREYFRYRAGARLQIREFGGYEGDPLALRRYANLLNAAHRDPRILGHANVRYVTGTKGPRPMKLDFNQLEPKVFELPAVAPAVAWYGGAQIVTSEAAALAALEKLTPGAGAILEKPTLGGASVPPPSTAMQPGKLVELGLNHLVAEVEAPAAGVVVVNEAYYPGWSATVDGAAATVLPANAAFRGVLVPAGRHRIEMRFSAGTAVRILVPLGLLALAAALGLLFSRR